MSEFVLVLNSDWLRGLYSTSIATVHSLQMRWANHGRKLNSLVSTNTTDFVFLMDLMRLIDKNVVVWTLNIRFIYKNSALSLKCVSKMWAPGWQQKFSDYKHTKNILTIDTSSGIYSWLLSMSHWWLIIICILISDGDFSAR